MHILGGMNLLQLRRCKDNYKARIQRTFGDFQPAADFHQVIFGERPFAPLPNLSEPILQKRAGLKLFT